MTLNGRDLPMCCYPNRRLWHSCARGRLEEVLGHKKVCSHSEDCLTSPKAASAGFGNNCSRTLFLISIHIERTRARVDLPHIIEVAPPVCSNGNSNVEDFDCFASPACLSEPLGSCHNCWCLIISCVLTIQKGLQLLASHSEASADCQRQAESVAQQLHP